jgi:hypothetical protein
VLFKNGLRKCFASGVPSTRLASIETEDILSASLPRAAVTTILDNIILQLERYDLPKALGLAEVLLRDRVPLPSLHSDVLQSAALTATLKRGMAEINLQAPITALGEFKVARDIWMKALSQRDDAIPIHACDEDLELYLLDRLHTDHKLTLESHLRGCSACAIKLTSAKLLVTQLAELGREQAVFDGKEKRTQPRRTTDTHGVLQRISPFFPDRVNVRILDVSGDGMRVGAPVSLEPGTTVKVRLKRTIAFGEVRYCRAVGSAYHAGVLLQNDIQI